MNQVAQNLAKAKARIQDPKHWTQREMARDAEGCYVLPFSTQAACWCSIGSLVAERVAPMHGSVFDTPEVQFLNKAVKEAGGSNIAHYNDTKSHADVMKMFDTAIEIANHADTV